MNDKIQLAKGITKFVVSTSVGSVVAKTLKTYAPAVTTTDKVQLVVAAYAVGGMAGDRAVEWVGPKFDEAVDLAQKIKSSLKDHA